MDILAIVILFIFLIYSILLLYYWKAWITIPDFQPLLSKGAGFISVIIPARNEEANIGNLILSIQNQTYPSNNFEVIVIDDNSTDLTSSIVSGFKNIRLVSLKEDQLNSYKKKAIETGINASKGNLIVTTDADCIVPPQWLETISAYADQTNAVFIAAPVTIACNNSVLQIFQSLDFMVLQGITGAAVHNRKLSMCNGANLAYEKKAFHEVNGFEDIDHIASGDDMLLMFKIEKQHPGRTFYLKSKEAIVSTTPTKTWKEFFNQRIRWASKAGKYQDKRILPVLLIVYLTNLCFPVLLVAGFVNENYWLFFLILLIAKTLVEYPLFISLCRFFNKQWAVKVFFLFQPLHILYTVIAGFLGQFRKYKWKGRIVR